MRIWNTFGFSFSIRSLLHSCVNRTAFIVERGSLSLLFYSYLHSLILFSISVMRMCVNVVPFPVYDLLKLTGVFALLSQTNQMKLVLNIKEYTMYIYYILTRPAFAFDTRCEFPFLIFAIWQSETVPVVKFFLCEYITNCETVRDNFQQ